ncbi:MAG: sugar kinase [Deltaproteobacteria bacterium]|nr:sugar kinase [Deltaproteobacteria bacterium]
MSEQAFQVYGLGQCPLDYIGQIDIYPPPDVKCEFSDLVMQGGGPAATALVALARWGVPCAFAGVVGDDLFGNMILASLTEEGVNTSGVHVRKGYESQFAFIVAEPDKGRRTIFWRRPTGPPLKPEELNFDIIRKAKVIHTDGLYIEASLAACKVAREAGVQVVVDGGTLREGMLDLARFSDYYLVSEAFAKSLVGDNNPLEACYRLRDIGPRVVGVTLGAKGYIALTRDRIIERPAYLVEAVDTTGCGDAFHAGVTFGIIRGWDIEKSLDLGAWAGAMVSKRFGGREGIPSLEKMAKFGY